jgi:TPR repeat protein
MLARGDTLLSWGDITSARLFYERAADAGDGLAALELATTFDPGFLGGLGVRGRKADPKHALPWYRPARDLGIAEAEHRMKDLIGEPDSRSR